MNEERYTLEWRGVRKGPWTFSEIERRLDDGDIHSMHSIHVDGRLIPLRDFLEEQRQVRKKAAAAERAAASVAAYAPPSVPSSAPPPPPPLGQQPAYHSVQEAHYPASHSLYRDKRKKSLGLAPALILGGVVIAVVAVLAGYLIANLGRNQDKPKPQASSKIEPKIETKSEIKEDGKVDVKEGDRIEVKQADKMEVRPSDKIEAKPGDKIEINVEKPRSRKFQVFSFTGKEIFPSAIISTATVDWNGDEQSAEDKKTDEDEQIGKRDVPIYGDENGWLGIKLEGLKKGVQVSVEINADGFMKPSKWQGTVNTTSQEGLVMVLPKIMWNFEALIKARQQRPINVIFSASVEGKALPDVTETYVMKSINDCPLYVANDKAGKHMTSLSFLFAAYVNENHPHVQDILREALGCHIVDAFDGYQSDDPKQVVLQVLSVWNALQRRGIKYSDVATTTPGDRVVSQSVRFMDQSMNGHQANCVDGTVLMASVLQKIGIHSYLVLVPGHCFLAFDLSRDSAALPTGLETTMLGNNEITEVNNIGLLPNQERLKEYDASVKTFLEAMHVGNQRIQGCARNLQGTGDVRYKLVSIEESRDSGIMPIPFTMDK